MSVTLRSFLASAVWLIGATPFGAGAEPLVVASASNFAPTARDIAARFEADTGQSVRVSSASTGKLYAQITQGAPFDVLLAADAERPRLLEDSGQAAAATRFTYAIGRLVLWSRDPAFSGADCREQLERLDHRRLAIANPDIAPYGEAARETLLKLGLWERVRPQLVVGENIGQTLQFVASGNASLGFIAATQSLDARLPETTCTWPVPPDLHRRIEQQAVLLSRAAENSAALDFMAFLRAAAGRAIIERHGYALPDQVDAWRE
jgi:molybdate transport system substrate-binding protein